MSDAKIARITGLCGIVCVAPDIRPISLVARWQSAVRIRGQRDLDSPTQHGERVIVRVA